MTVLRKISGAALNQGLQFKQVLKCSRVTSQENIVLLGSKKDTSGLCSGYLYFLVIETFACVINPY